MLTRKSTVSQKTNEATLKSMAGMTDGIFRENGMKAIDDKIICTIEEASEKQGQIVAPKHVRDAQNSTVGVVIAVGPGRMLESGSRNDLDVAVGDRVVVSKHCNAIKVSGTLYIVAESIDVLAVLNKDQKLDAFQG